MKKLHSLWLLVLLTGLFTLTACEEDVDEPKKDDPTGTTKLSVTPSSLSFSAAGGKKSLTVKSSYEMFGVDSSADWLDFDYDEVRDIVYVTAEANPTDKVRQANVTIMGTNDGEKILERVTVKVEQEAGEGNKNETNATATISPSGGKVEVGDISIDFPSGTFSSDAQVTVTEVEKGTIGGEDELSKYYKVTIPAGVRKSFKVAIEIPKVTSNGGEEVKMQFAMNGYAPSLGKELMVDFPMDVTYANGAYVAEIPAMDDPDDAAETDLYFGLCTYLVLDDASAANTRAATKAKLNLCHPKSLPKNYNDVYKFLKTDKKLQEAIDKIESLGFKKVGTLVNLDIEYEFERPWLLDADGFYVRSSFGKQFCKIVLNSEKIEKLKTSNFATSLMQTVIHETFHYYEAFYDPRSCAGIMASFPHWTGALILDEAGSVWIERFYTKDNNGNNMTPSVAKDNVLPFLASVKYFNEDIHDVSEVMLKWGDRFQNTGYGMACLIEYLYKKYGKEFVLDMFERRRFIESDPNNTVDIVEASASLYGTEIFSQTGYKDFVEALGTKQVYPDLSFNGIMSSTSNKRVIHDDSIGVLRRELYDEKPVYFTNKVFGYGALIEELNVDGNLIDVVFDGYEKTKTTIEQTTKGLTTWVYGYKNNNCYLIGSTKKGSPLDVSEIYYINNHKVFSNGCYFVTIADDFKTDEEIMSRIVAKVEKATLKIEPKTLTFEAEGGTQEVTVTHNQKKLSYSISDKSWIKWGYVEGQSNKRTVTVEPNNTTEERKGTIILSAKDANDKVVIRDTIFITQKTYGVPFNSPFLGEYWYSVKDQNDGKAPVLKLNWDGTFYSSLGGQVQEGHYVVKSYNKGEGIIIESSGNEVKFSYREHYSEWGGGYYKYLTYGGTDLVRWVQVDM